jgi:hypothetical protein
MSTAKQGLAAEQRKKIIVYSVFGLILLAFVLYAYNALFAGSSPAPVPQAAPVAVVAPKTGTSAGGEAKSAAPAAGAVVAPGVAATKMASTSSSLDPTLDETAMLRTESLVYSGTGRNIFSATYVKPVELPKNVPPARHVQVVPQPVVQPGPPPPPPINLKFFGTETLANGTRQAFLLAGEDVYLASAGDIVERKYKIVAINAGSIQVEDLTNHNTQTLPLQMN